MRHRHRVRRRSDFGLIHRITQQTHARDRPQKMG